MAVNLADDQAERFAVDGYCVWPDALTPAELDSLREEADLAVRWQDARMARREPVDSINRRGQHYFVPGRSRERRALQRYVLGERMAQICRRLVGQTAYLFTELFVCKEAHCELSFDWHQDSGYVHAFGFGEYPPNLTIWAALDDATDENGALWVEPFGAGSPRAVVPHRRREHDQLGADFEIRAPVLLEVAAGSLIILSGLLPHRSGPNRTTFVRRAHLSQFGPRPILKAGRPVQMAEPLLLDGVYVAR